MRKLFSVIFLLCLFSSLAFASDSRPVLVRQIGLHQWQAGVEVLRADLTCSKILVATSFNRQGDQWQFELERSAQEFIRITSYNGVEVERVTFMPLDQ